MELTADGVQKAVDWGVRQGLRLAAVRLPSIKIPDLEFGPEKAKCTPEKVSAMSVADAWKVCYGLPKALTPGSGPWSDLVMPEPSRVKLSGLQIDKIRFDKPNVKCNRLECDIELTIPELSLKGNVSVTDLNNPKNVRFAAKGLSAGISKKANGQAAKVRFKGRLDSNGKLKNLIQVGKDKIFPTLPPGMLSVGVDLNEKEAAEGEKRMSLALYDSLKSTEKLAEAKTDNDKIKIVNELLKRKPGIIKTEEGKNAVTIGLRAAIRHRFDSAESADLFLIGKWFFEEAVQDPEINQILTDLIARRVLPPVAAEVDQLVKDLPLVHQQLVQQVRVLPVQDQLDVSQIKAAIKEQQDELDKVGRQIRSAQTPDQIRAAAEALSLAKDRAVEISAMIHSLQAADQKSALVSQLKQQWSSVPSLEGRTSSLSFDDSFLPDSITQHFALQAVAAQAGKLNETLQVAFSVCRLCSGSQPPAMDMSQNSPFHSARKYDAAIQINLSTINHFITEMHAAGQLDFCLTDSKTDICAGPRDSVGKTRFRFSEAPFLVWDDEKKALIVNIPQINQGEGLLGNAASAEIRMELGVSSDGKKVVFTPKDLDTGFRINDSGFFGVVGGLLKALTGVFVIVQNEVVAANAPEILKAMGSAEVPVAEGFALKEVTAGKDSIALYGHLNLPDLPIDRKVRAQAPARAPKLASQGKPRASALR